MAQDSTDSLILITQQSAKIASNLTLQNQILQQWISLSIGSSSATLLNLLNTELETFNLSASTFFYNGYISDISPSIDNIWTLSPTSAPRLAGVINPANLKYSGHYQGVGSFPYGNIIADKPIYNSTYSYQLEISGYAVSLSLASLFSLSAFTGGTPSSSSGTASNAFDGNVSTSDSLTGVSPTYIQYQLSSAQILNSFLIVSSTNEGIFSIQGSNDGSTWTNLPNQTPGGYSGSGQFYNWVSSSNITSYLYYRMYLNSNPTATIYEFMGFTNNPVANYDTSNYVFGSSSLQLKGNGYLSGTQSTSGELALTNYNWQMRGYFRFSTSPGNSNGNWMTLWTVPNTLEIQATSTGLQVRYSNNGSSFTQVLSSNFSWSTNTWYYISVRRTGNTLYFYVNGVQKGTISLTGNLYSVNSSFFIGADSTGSNLYNGNMQEVEFFIGPSQDVDNAPGVARNTAFIPSVTWISGTSYIASGLTALNSILMIDQVTFQSFGVPVANTDWQFFVSCNNGITWTQIPLTASGSLSTLTTMYVGSISATKITNTNQLQYKIVSTSGKVIKCDGIILNWQ